MHWIPKLIKFLVLMAPFMGTCISIYCVVTGKVKRKDVIFTYVYFLIGGLGITVGFHRLLTHSSFETTRPIKAALLTIASMMWQGSVLFWTATHRAHHRFADMIGDPHSPWAGFSSRFRGFLWSHFLWLIEPDNTDRDTYVPVEQEDALVMTIDRLFPVCAFLSIAIPVWMRGKRGALCALTAIFFVQHVTMSVNSVCHIWGSRLFQEVRNRSVNNWVVGFLGLGEGWHNNHHAYQNSAFQGFLWWQFDLSGWFILILEKLGLATHVVRPKLSVLIKFSGDPDLGTKINSLFVECDVDPRISHPELVAA